MPTSLRDIIATSHYRQRFERRGRAGFFSNVKTGGEGGATFRFDDDGTFEVSADPVSQARTADGQPAEDA
jgi:hypothetical protein